MASPETFDIPIGKVVGPKGDTGNGISGIELLSTSGLQKTYRINMTNETHFDFVVTDGNGITGASFDAETNKLTITFDNGTSFTTPSLKGAPGNPGDDGYSPAVTIETITGGHRVTITDKDHPTGQSFDVMDGEDGASDAGEVTYDKTAAYNDGTVGKAVSDLEDTVSTTQIINTASGAIASFDDGADSMPIKSLVAQIEPVQDLHGYDSPWPAGGGKNMFDPQKIVDAGGSFDGTKYIATQSVFENASLSYITFEENTQYYFFVHGKVTSTNESALMRIIVTYTDSTTQALLLVGTTESDRDGTSTSGKTIQSIHFSAYGSIGSNTTEFTKFMICKASAGTLYAPYENSCPISGHTGAEIEQTGKNLYHEEVAPKSTGEIQVILNQDGSRTFKKLVATTTRSYNERVYGNVENKYGIPLKGGVTYCIFGINVQINNVSRGATNQPLLYTAKDGDYVNYIWYYFVDGDLTSERTYYPRIIESTDINEPYIPWSNQEISVTFPTEAGDSGIVYGGTLTINPDRTGTLVVDRAMDTFDGSADENWTFGNASRRYTRGQLTHYCKYTNSASTPPLVSNIAVPVSQETTYGTITYSAVSAGIEEKNIVRYVYAGVTDTLTIDEFRTWLSNNNLQVLYLLETPITIQLTAEQVSGILSTLYGQNNIWSNTGDTEVTYPADTKLYIDGKIAEALGG